MWLIFYGLVAHFFATNTPKIATKGEKLPPNPPKLPQIEKNCHRFQNLNPFISVFILLFTLFSGKWQ